MKRLILSTALAASVFQTLAQDAQIVERGPDYRVVEHVLQTVTEEGETILSTNRHTELSTGMHYWTGAEWKESNPQFKLVPGFAVADEVQHHFTVSANINQEGAIVMETPDGKVFRSTPLFLAFRDTATGESVVLGTIQDSIGEQIAPDQIFYPAALDGVACGIRYTIKRAGIEQELVIQEPLKPEDWGLNNAPTVRLELWTVFY